jgi:hypothetical protein
MYIYEKKMFLRLGRLIVQIGSEKTEFLIFQIYVAGHQIYLNANNACVISAHTLTSRPEKMVL